MVCGVEIRSSSADTARTYILEQYFYILDLSFFEKSNILEVWSEGVVFLQDVRVEQLFLFNLGSWVWGGVRGAGWREMSDFLEYLEFIGYLFVLDLGQEVDVDSDFDLDFVKMLAEIVVFFDFEDNLFFFKRSRFRGFRFFEFFGQLFWKLVRLRWGAGWELQVSCSGGREVVGQVCSVVLRLRGLGVVF